MAETKRFQCPVGLPVIRYDNGTWLCKPPNIGMECISRPVCDDAATNLSAACETKNLQGNALWDTRLPDMSKENLIDLYKLPCSPEHGWWLLSRHVKAHKVGQASRCLKAKAKMLAKKR
ncbi:MAG: hypothetical protein WBA51_05000 [Erythrobacter sp.]